MLLFSLTLSPCVCVWKMKNHQSVEREQQRGYHLYCPRRKTLPTIKCGTADPLKGSYQSGTNSCGTRVTSTDIHWIEKLFLFAEKMGGNPIFLFLLLGAPAHAVLSCSAKRVALQKPQS